MGGALELVLERLQLLDFQCRAHEPVREVGVLRQQRPVQVGPTTSARPHALAAVAAVVAVPAQDAPERSLVRPEVGAPAVVLEADERVLTAVELELDRDVAGQPRASSRTMRASTRPMPSSSSSPSASRSRAAGAAAHGEDHRAATGRGVEGVLLGLDEVARHEPLVAVLAAAEVEEVVRVGVERSPSVTLACWKPIPRQAQRCPEHQDVAAVGVDVHRSG